jgi:hypothetical protein
MITSSAVSAPTAQAAQSSPNTPSYSTALRASWYSTTQTNSASYSLSNSTGRLTLRGRAAHVRHASQQVTGCRGRCGVYPSLALD